MAPLLRISTSSEEFEEERSSMTTTVSDEKNGRMPRSVSFSEGEPVVHKVIHVDEYSPTEKRDCWYDIEEIDRIRRDAKLERKAALMNLSAPLREDVIVETKGTTTAACRLSHSIILMVAFVTIQYVWNNTNCF